ncbi:hypothetical protein GCK72_018892 [Caenorhabditis remanei]|nr:hypothetical protein GCK72_018892 [Caenorhabditis remanei]KAF1752338.1 hypothetical protein GCK72_018892 [Caenorhabditis remanei]
MTSLVWMVLIGMAWAAEPNSFRSILIERACEKRPDLDFCGPSSPAQPLSSSVVPLVVPPMPTTTASTTTTTTEKPSTTASSTTTDSLNFDDDSDSNSTSSTEHEKLGSLVKLPKPEKSSTEKVVDQVIEHSGIATSDEPPKNSSSVSEVKIEDEKGVLVFVSEYCVVERERFVRGCHGDIDKKEETFCKTYVAACASTTGVLPVMTYCARYYTYYPTHCKTQLVERNALQFCFAFEQFCLPEKTAAQAQSQKPKSSLRKCEDVLPEARKVCNPFPNPKDTFNLLRCTHFLTNCKKFVDWL